MGVGGGGGSRRRGGSWGGGGGARGPRRRRAACSGGEDEPRLLLETRPGRCQRGDALDGLDVRHRGGERLRGDEVHVTQRGGGEPTRLDGDLVVGHEPDQLPDRAVAAEGRRAQLLVDVDTARDHGDRYAEQPVQGREHAGSEGVAAVDPAPVGQLRAHARAHQRHGERVAPAVGDVAAQDGERRPLPEPHRAHDHEGLADAAHLTAQTAAGTQGRLLEDLHHQPGLVVQDLLDPVEVHPLVQQLGGQLDLAQGRRRQRAADPLGPLDRRALEQLEPGRGGPGELGLGRAPAGHHRDAEGPAVRDQVEHVVRLPCPEVDLHHGRQGQQRLDAGRPRGQVQRDRPALQAQLPAAVHDRGVAALVGGDLQHGTAGRGVERGPTREELGPGPEVQLAGAHQRIRVEGRVPEHRDHGDGVLRGVLARVGRGHRPVVQPEGDDLVVPSDDRLSGHHPTRGDGLLGDGVVKLLSHGRPGSLRGVWS